MRDLIEALQIFAKYTDATHPTNCSHDMLGVCGVGAVSAEDAVRLEELGFSWDKDKAFWFSFRFGST
jgi:hypothetical protein